MPPTELTTPEAHGRLGTRERAFMRLLPPNPQPFDDAKLRALADAMIIDDTELNDGADAEENLFVPAGYTYFGQFVDHDITFDPTPLGAAERDTRSTVRIVSDAPVCLARPIAKSTSGSVAIRTSSVMRNSGLSMSGAAMLIW